MPLKKLEGCHHEASIKFNGGRTITLKCLKSFEVFYDGEKVFDDAEK